MVWDPVDTDNGGTVTRYTVEYTPRNDRDSWDDPNNEDKEIYVSGPDVDAVGSQSAGKPGVPFGNNINSSTKTSSINTAEELLHPRSNRVVALATTDSAIVLFSWSATSSLVRPLSVGEANKLTSAAPELASNSLRTMGGSLWQKRGSKSGAAWTLPNRHAAARVSEATRPKEASLPTLIWIIFNIPRPPSSAEEATQQTCSVDWWSYLFVWLLHAAAIVVAAFAIAFWSGTCCSNGKFSLLTKRTFLGYLLLFSAFEEPISAAAFGVPKSIGDMGLNVSVGHRRLSTDVSTFSALSSAIASDADINVVSDITFTAVITISGMTGLAISSSNGAVMTSDRSFSNSYGGMFYIASGSDVTFTGLGFASGSASDRGGCFYVTGSSTVEMEDVEVTNCYAYVRGLEHT